MRRIHFLLCASFLLAAPLGAGGCDPSIETLSGYRSDPRAIFDLRVRSSVEPFHVRTVRATEVGEGSLDISIEFSHPVSRPTFISVVRLRPVEDTPAKGSPAMGAGVEPRSAVPAVWTADARQVVIRFDLPPTHLAVVELLSRIQDVGGRPLDGSVAPWISDSISDSTNYARFDDDGYAGPATFWSLPIGYGEADELRTHPFTPLHEARPGVRVGVSSRGSPVTTVTVPVSDPTDWPSPLTTGAVIVVELDNRAHRAAPPGVHDRVRRRAWRPETISGNVEILDAGGASVPVSLALDTRGLVSYGLVSTVEATPSSASLRLAAESAWIAAIEPRQPMLRISGDATVDRAYPVASNAGRTLTLDDVLAQGVGRPARGDATRIFDTAGTWVADEFASQIFDLSGTQKTIESNTGAVLIFKEQMPCGSNGCPYTVRLDATRTFSAGSTVEWLGNWLTVVPKTDLEPGAYTLRIRGGVGGLSDLYGLPVFDGKRDGNELTGEPDDTISMTFRVQ